MGNIVIIDKSRVPDKQISHPPPRLLDRVFMVWYFIPIANIRVRFGFVTLHATNYHTAYRLIRTT